MIYLGTEIVNENLKTERRYNYYMLYPHIITITVSISMKEASRKTIYSTASKSIVYGDITHDEITHQIKLTEYIPGDLRDTSEYLFRNILNGLIPELW